MNSPRVDVLAQSSRIKRVRKTVTSEILAQPPLEKLVIAGTGTLGRLCECSVLPPGQGAGNLHAAAAVRLGGPGVVRPPSHVPAGAVRSVLAGAAAARGAAGR